MFPAVRNVLRPTRRGWRRSLQLIGTAVLVLVLTATGSRWTRSRAETPGASCVADGGTGGPRVPVPPAGRYDLAADLGKLDTIGPETRHDLLDLSAAAWNPGRPAWHERLLRLLPVAPVRITSGFGRRHDPFGRGDAFHSGIDFAGSIGTPVRASGDGVVVQARYSKDYGNVVMIDHGEGVVTLYAHNSRLEVHAGDVVLAGQEISRMGSTGRSTGPHLHFEVRRYGQRIDPGRYLAGL